MSPETEVHNIGIPNSTELEAEAVEADAPTLEIPDSHPQVDAKIISVDGLIKMCPYFADMAGRNPELAEAKASAVIQHAEERAEIREGGMEEADIKKQQWAAMRQRHRQKMVNHEGASTKRFIDAKITAMTQINKPDIAAAANIADEVAHLEEQSSEIVLYRVTSDEEQVSGRETSVPAQDNLPSPGPHKSSGPEILDRVIASIRSEPIDSQMNNQVTPTSYGVQERTKPKPDPKPVINKPDTSRERHESAIGFTDSELPDAPVVSPKDQAIIKPGTSEIPDEQVDTLPLHTVALQDDDQKPGDIITARPIEDIVVLPMSLIEDPLPNIEQEQHEIHLYDSRDERSLHGSEDSIEVPPLLIKPDEPQDAEIKNESVFPEAQETQALPDIAITLVEEFSELSNEDKEIVIPMLEDIIEMAKSIEMTKVDEIEPEVIEMMHKELKGLIINSFEHLDMEYSVGDVQRFIMISDSSDFRIQFSEMIKYVDVNLDRDGTHESKTHFPTIASVFVTKMEHSLERLLGMFILFGIENVKAN